MGVRGEEAFFFTYRGVAILIDQIERVKFPAPAKKNPHEGLKKWVGDIVSPNIIIIIMGFICE